MTINEKDVSILIPTYNSEIFIKRCLTSAINSNAGEIIISDDCSIDNTIKVIESFQDDRINLIKNPTRLGLWENHLKLLLFSTKSWLKFLQADDYLAENGLQAFCENEQENLSIVSAISINEWIDTSEQKAIFKLSQKKRWSSVDYLQRLKIVGNELGTPSNTLINKKSFILDPSFWISNVSSDLIMNVIAASKGDVVLLPSGPAIRTVHANQDTSQQTIDIIINRLINSVHLLRQTNNKQIISFANIFYIIESIGIIRMILGQMLRGKIKIAIKFFNLFRSQGINSFKVLFTEFSYIVKMYKWKFGRRDSFNLDF